VETYCASKEAYIPVRALGEIFGTVASFRLLTLSTVFTASRLWYIQGGYRCVPFGNLVAKDQSEDKTSDF